MQHAICSRSIGWVFTACLRLTSVIAVAVVGASSTSVGQAISMDQTVLSQEASTTSDQDLPLDALGYLGGLFEARFYEPHSTTDDPRDEIRGGRFLVRLGLGNDDVDCQSGE